MSKKWRKTVEKAVNENAILSRRAAVLGGAGILTGSGALIHSLLEEEEDKREQRGPPMSPTPTETPGPTPTESPTATPTAEDTATPTPEIGALPAGWRQGIPDTCEVSQEEVINDLASQGYPDEDKYFKNDTVRPEEVIYNEEDGRLIVAGWDYVDRDWDRLLDYGEDSC